MSCQNQQNDMKIVTGRNKPIETPAIQIIYGSHK